MAQTTIISSIDRSNTYPESILISATSNCGTIMLTLGGTWTKQMVAELPTINIKMFTLDNEWFKDFNLDIDTSSIFTEDGIAQNATFQLYDIPQSFYLKINPVFDNEALTAHNNTQENGVVSSIKTVNGIVTNDEPDIWTTITNTFDIELVFDDTSIVPGGGGGSATLIEKTITANGEYNASDDSADGYSKVDVNVPNTYTAEDEGKVVDNGTLVAQTAMPSEVTENGTIDTTLYNSVSVNVPSGGGGGSGAKKDVNFYDYDGTIVNSYTAAEFANLNAMPENPTHDGLTAQGWNWSLQDAKTYVASYGKLEIGQMYITSDEKTRLYITLHDGRLEPVLGLGINGSVDVDWGDGTAHDTMTGSGLSATTYKKHIYAAEGDYVITLTVTGSIQFNGTSTYTYLLTKQSGSESTNKVYSNSLTRIEVGSGVTSIGSAAFSACSSLSSITIPQGVTSIDSYVFQGCYSLSSITIPQDVTSIGNNVFQNCYLLSSITIPKSVTSISNFMFNNGSLSSVTIPQSVTSIGDYAFSACYPLSSITIPQGVNSIGSAAFNDCYSLSSITIPQSVNSIGSSAFNGNYGLGKIIFKNSTPPTISASNAFLNLQKDCIIYVPTGSLSSYTSASNYPSSSKYTYVEY